MTTIKEDPPRRFEFTDCTVRHMEKPDGLRAVVCDLYLSPVLAS